jgi:hypothetical protein
MNWELPLSLFAAFLAWGSAANIMRLTRFVGQRSWLTLLTGLLSFVGVHLLPVYLHGWIYGIGLVVLSYVITGPLNGLIIGRYTGNVEWPENFRWQTRFGPILYFSISLALLGVIFWNHIK